MRKRNYTECNNVVHVMYDLRPNIEKAMSIARVIGYIAAVGSIIGCLVGALAGLGLSFTALSPLVIGGAVGAVFPALLAFVAIGARYCFRNEINELKKEEGFVEKRVIAALMPLFIPMTVISIATGVGLAAATNAVLLGIFATWWAIAVGAGIGAIALLAGSLLEYIMPDKYVVGPRVTQTEQKNGSVIDPTS
ncbi:MAG: hypothetical protein LBP77_03240 [Rickettsiales bacterium]|jgi:uncharacterized membrane protein|nr:hypothetical protein [Rickettsiales bacterium]